MICVLKLVIKVEVVCLAKLLLCLTKLLLESNQGHFIGGSAVPCLDVILEFSSVIKNILGKVNYLRFGVDCLTCFSKELQVFDDDKYLVYQLDQVKFEGLNFFCFSWIH